MARFSDILTTRLKVAAEDMEALAPILAKYPQLEESVVDAQEFQVVKSSLTDTQKKLAAWNDPKDGWLAKAWDAEHGMTTAQYAAEQRAATLAAKVAEMEAGGGISGDGTMPTFEEIEAHMKAKGFINASDPEALKAAGLAKAADFEQKLANQGGNYEYLYVKTAPLMMKYMKEFGDVPDDFMQNLFAVITSDATGEFMKDPSKAYEQSVAPKRLEAERTKLAADRAAFETQKADLEAKKNQVTSPTDTEGAGSVAPYQMREDNPDNNPIDKVLNGAKFGTGQLARNLAAAYKNGELTTSPAVN